MRTSYLLFALLVAPSCARRADTDTDPPADTDTDTDSDTDTDTDSDTDTDTDSDTDTDTDSDTDTDTDTDPPGPVDLYGDPDPDCDFVPGSDPISAEPAMRANAVILAGRPARDALSDGGRAILDAGNLGGSSIDSEILAFEVLHRCEGASLELTQGDVPYKDPSGKKTDLVVSLEGERLGVSVTRAVGYPPDAPWGVDRATTLLTDKLEDIARSTANVADEARWTKQFLFVAAYTADHGAALRSAFDALPADVRGDTIVVVTVTDDDDDFVYFR